MLSPHHPPPVWVGRGYSNSSRGGGSISCRFVVELLIAGDWLGIVTNRLTTGYKLTHRPWVGWEGGRQ